MIKILAIESSCDETAASVVEDGRKVLSNIISSQIPQHKLYGGVVPEIASRKHIEKINQVTSMALEEAKTDISDIDAVAVTSGPGLVGALLVGVSFAKSLAYAAEKPIIAVNHIDGHISANYLCHYELEPPFLCLVVSGGHTHLVKVLDYGLYEVMGRTMDDAAGEAFDKVARAIGLGYPGGPKIEALSAMGDPYAIKLPKPKFKNNTALDFSFSGLKSAVLNYINSAEMKGEEIVKADLAASFQNSVIEVLKDNLLKGAHNSGIKKIALAGGVTANKTLRSAIQTACNSEGYSFYCPDIILCTDNAAMIGAAAYHSFIKGQFAPLSLNADPALKLGE